jgi:cystathionine beta-lyase family protein involved in aluminum resistance
VAQELKRSRYSQSYRFDQGKIVVFCDKQRSIAAFLCADKFFFLVLISLQMQNPNCMVMVDNCYGEFVETSEPAMVVCP